MYKSNYHSHTEFCDGKLAPEAHILAAIEVGFDSFGFSSHAPLPFHVPWSMKAGQLNNYITETKRLKEKYQGNLEVYTGLEVDYVPGLSGPNAPAIKEAQLDYIIGSVHFVDQFPDGRHWEIDGARTTFLAGLKEIFDGDTKAAVKKYFHYTRKMIREETPDILGHMDKIKMQNQPQSLFSEEDSWYKREVMDTLEEVANSSCIIEVNTRGLYKKRAHDLYPGKWTLQKIKELNIQITLSSDSHAPHEIDELFHETAETLKSLGFRNKMVLKNRQWEEYPL